MGVVRMQLLPAYDTLLVYWPCLRSAEERLRAFLGNDTVELVHSKKESWSLVPSKFSTARLPFR